MLLGSLEHFTFCSVAKAKAEVVGLDPKTEGTSTSCNALYEEALQFKA